MELTGDAVEYRAPAQKSRPAARRSHTTDVEVNA